MLNWVATLLGTARSVKEPDIVNGTVAIVTM